MTEYVSLSVDLGEVINVVFQPDISVYLADERVTSDGSTRDLSDGDVRVVETTYISTEVLTVEAVNDFINVVV